MFSKECSAVVRETMSAEAVEAMNSNALCDWLIGNPMFELELDEDERELVIATIKAEGIKGRNFLRYSFDLWHKNIPAGPAESLFHIAQTILRGASPVIEPVHELKEATLLDLQRDMPAPSSFSKDRSKGCWVEFIKNHPDQIICHRNASEKPSVPVCLLSPVFTQFAQDLDTISISSSDCEFVTNLTDSMCGAFSSEGERMHKFFDLFETYTGWKLLVLKYDKSETDGSLHFRNGALYCNLEVKVEKGSGGGDPYMQCIAYYIKSLPQDAVNTQYPCFLLELCGTAFSVSGIVNTDRQVVCDPLSPTYQLLCNQTLIITEKIARLFASLRKGLETLQQKENTGFLRASPFPYLSCFRQLNSNVEVNVQYQQRLKGLLFCAKLVDRDLEVVVKFCSRYNQDVHLYCYSLGFAPALICVQSLGSHVAVVMEKLSLRPLGPDDVVDSQIREQVSFIVEKLQERNYVHGDMRSTNVLFDVLAKRVVLVDFDWAGVDGIAVYPPFMNPVINWPKGAVTGQPIRHQHDRYWLEDFGISELSTSMEL
jgi:hypothetical protein